MNLDARSFLELKGNVVYLKKLDPEYAEEYWKDLSNCSIESMIFTGSQQIFSKSDIDTYLDSISSDKSRIDFLIFSKESNKAVGEVVINDIYRNSRSGSMRVSINRKEDFNKGYGSEAIILALNYVFGMLNLHRVELEAFLFNERAIHVYEQIGFKREGIKRDGWFYNHKYYDMVTMSILEDEFREKYDCNELPLDEFNN